MHVPAADVEAVPGDAILDLGGLVGVIEAAEEERSVRDVFQRLGPVVEVGLEEFLGERVTAHSLEGQHVLAHQAQVFPGAAKLVALRRQNEITDGPFGII